MRLLTKCVVVSIGCGEGRILLSGVLVVHATCCSRKAPFHAAPIACAPMQLDPVERPQHAESCCGYTRKFACDRTRRQTSNMFLGTQILWQDKVLNFIMDLTCPGIHTWQRFMHAWVSYLRSLPRSKIMATKVLPLLTFGQDTFRAFLAGQDSCMHENAFNIYRKVFFLLTGTIVHKTAKPPVSQVDNGAFKQVAVILISHLNSSFW